MLLARGSHFCLERANLIAKRLEQVVLGWVSEDSAIDGLAISASTSFEMSCIIQVVHSLPFRHIVWSAKNSPLNYFSTDELVVIQYVGPEVKLSSWY